MKIARHLAGPFSRKNPRRSSGPAAIAQGAIDEKLMLAARSFLRRVGS